MRVNDLKKEVEKKKKEQTVQNCDIVRVAWLELVQKQSHFIEKTN